MGCNILVTNYSATVLAIYMYIDCGVFQFSERDHGTLTSKNTLKSVQDFLNDRDLFIRLGLAIASASSHWSLEHLAVPT